MKIASTQDVVHWEAAAAAVAATKSPLKGPGCHVAEIMAAVDFVVPA